MKECKNEVLASGVWSCMQAFKANSKKSAAAQVLEEFQVSCRIEDV